MVSLSLLYTLDMSHSTGGNLVRSHHLRKSVCGSANLVSSAKVNLFKVPDSD